MSIKVNMNKPTESQTSGAKESISEQDENNGESSKAMLLKMILILVAFGSFYLVSRYFGEFIDLKMVESVVKQAGPLAPILYMSFYVIAPTLLFPASILTMAGGLIFGPFWGTAYTIVSATAGATVPFLISRKLGRKPMEKMLSRYENFDERFHEFEAEVSKEGWKYVAFTRLVTLFPFLILNYAFGLTSINLWTYVWASFVFMLPGSFMFTYMGYAGREALGGSENSLTLISIACGIFIFLSALPGLIKRMRRKVDSR